MSGQKQGSKKDGFALQDQKFISSIQLSTIYKSHIRSQMEYCSPLWDGAGQTVLGRLVRKQNRETMLVDERSVTVNILSLQTLRNVASLSLFNR